MQPTLVVMAAGMGSRYGGLKQIDPVGPSGETIIDYSVYDAVRAGFARLVFVIRRDIEAPFREAVGRRFETRIAVDYAFQELANLPQGFSVPEGRTKPWGTTHAILQAEELVNEPFAVINADDFYGRESFQVMGGFLRSGSTDYSMVGYTLRNTLSEHGSVTRGVCECDPQDYLRTIVELLKIERQGNGVLADGRVLTGDELASMNFWGFTPLVFPQLRERFYEFMRRHGRELKSECFIPTTVNELVAAGVGRVKVLRTPSSWFGVTYQEDKPRVTAGIRQLIARCEYPQKLWE
ncbi:MAG TPA: sugar phosphate nucleotidyltransferase [Verrucomicrobiae bacterium]|nr:sugar phosphate nucleotidyltransferase [Verrucomicrobiae bacterium]